MQFLSFNYKGSLKKVWALRRGSQLWWHVDGRAWMYDFTTRPQARVSQQSQKIGDTSLKAPLPGRVIKVQVTEGQQVQPHQTLIILEAMKMEHSLKSNTTARVVKLNCRVGDQVTAGQELLQLR